MPLVLLQRLAVDEDVVEEHEDELVEELTERLMHEMHEGGWRVGETERQHEELEVTVARAKRRLRHVVSDRCESDGSRCAGRSC